MAPPEGCRCVRRFVKGREKALATAPRREFIGVRGRKGTKVLGDLVERVSLGAAGGARALVLLESILRATREAAVARRFDLE
jgi:hypothetical protein